MKRIYQNIVLGAGVIGCSVAYELAKGKSTLVLDKQSLVGQGTSLAAGGILMYNKSVRRPKEWHLIASQAISYHKKLEKELDEEVQWNWHGRAELACTYDDNAIKRITAKYELEKNYGSDVIWLSENDTRKRFFLEEQLPVGVGRGFQGYVNKQEGWVHPAKLCKALFNASKKNGAEFLFDAEVQRVFFKNGHGYVVLTDGSVAFQAENIIIALGSDIGEIEIEGIEIPKTTPVKGESILLKGIQPKFKEVLYANGIWCVPRSDGLFIGATREQGNKSKYSTIKVATLLQKFIDLFPVWADHSLSAVEYYYGLRSKTSNGIPIIGKDRQVPNLIWAIGLESTGFLMAPYIGAAIAKVLN